MYVFSSQKAEADLAYELQSCKIKQKIQEEKMEIVVSVLAKKPIFAHNVSELRLID